MGFSTAFEIQDKTLPLTLTGRYDFVMDWPVGGAWWLVINCFCRDVIGRAITGSGKTLAFALPIIHTLSKR